MASHDCVSDFLVSKSITGGVSSSPSIIMGVTSFLLVLSGHFSNMSCGTKGLVVPCIAGTFTPLALFWDLVCKKMCLLNSSGNFVLVFLSY